jgi:hypothetical protein
LAFETAALAPTEVTELAVRPHRRTAMFALAGIIVAIGAAFAVRNGTGTSVTPPPVVVHHDSIAPKPVAVAPTVAEPPPTPVKKAVDTVAQRLRRARRDSIKLANAAAAAAAAAPPDPGSIKAAVLGYARAIEFARVDRLREAYPNLSPAEQESWEKNFARATKIKANVRMGAIVETEKDKSAEADFTLRLTYDTESGETSSSLKYHAILAKTPNGWQITDLKK